MIAAASFLHDGEVVHYFLGGSASEYLALRPNNLLMYEAICWAKHRGYRFFNLGGGYKEHLARFKATFSKLSTTFYTYRTIHQPTLYDELERKYTRYRANLGQLNENSDHFPGYRADNSGQA
jgi:lipid II:glycine glycyltransferase (peptidoglycan interpeptide bridge formation enzyme)